MAKARSYQIGPINGPGGTPTATELRMIEVAKLVLSEGDHHGPDLDRAEAAWREEARRIHDSRRLFGGCQVFEAKRRIRTGTVYVAGYDGFVKIGFTAGAVNARVEALQTGCPVKIEVLWQTPGSFHLERALHERFAPLRAQGEWFRREGDLAEWINGGCRL